MRRHEIRIHPWEERPVEWEFDECGVCSREISRNRYVSESSRHTWTKWVHRETGRRECVFYAKPVTGVTIINE